MIVKNLRNGEKYETTQEEFKRLVTDQGNGYLYQVVEDETPIEVKSLREMKLKSKGPGTVTEVKPEAPGVQNVAEPVKKKKQNLNTQNGA